MKATNKQAHESHLEPGKLLRRKTVANRFDTSEEFLRLANDSTSPYFIPNFPVPIRIGKNIVAYIEAELLDWIAKCERVSTRSQG